MDYLGSIEHGEETPRFFDQLPDAAVFEVKGFPALSWYDQLLAFLNDGVLSEDMTTDKKIKFSLKSDLTW